MVYITLAAVVGLMLWAAVFSTVGWLIGRLAKRLCGSQRSAVDLSTRC